MSGAWTAIGFRPRPVPRMFRSWYDSLIYRLRVSAYYGGAGGITQASNDLPGSVRRCPRSVAPAEGTHHAVPQQVSRRAGYLQMAPRASCPPYRAKGHRPREGCRTSRGHFGAGQG